MGCFFLARFDDLCRLRKSFFMGISTFSACSVNCPNRQRASQIMAIAWKYTEDRMRHPDTPCPNEMRGNNPPMVKPRRAFRARASERGSSALRDAALPTPFVACSWLLARAWRSIRAPCELHSAVSNIVPRLRTRHVAQAPSRSTSLI